MYAGRPIIGICGGIGSGKSTIARMFGDLGCVVIDSDEQVQQAYRDKGIQDQLRVWWGNEIFSEAGQVSRSAIARRVFGDPGERTRLERLIHPWVSARREQEMARGAKNDPVFAFVWDSPLLFETGLNGRCDETVFVDVPIGARVSRVRQNRGWDEGELARREKLQWPLDKKREISDHVIDNTSDADVARDQVRQVLSRILAKYSAYSTELDGTKKSCQADEIRGTFQSSPNVKVEQGKGNADMD